MQGEFGDLLFMLDSKMDSRLIVKLKKATAANEQSGSRVS